MKLTADLIEQCAQYTNPATNDREISFRGYKINEIENLGATLDQFDCLDFTNNDLRKLENFPLLKRVRCLLLSNNRIQRIAPDLSCQLPNLERLMLLRNEIQLLGDLDVLSECQKLRFLCLQDNPVTTKQHYRLYVIHKLPQLRVLDFKRIRLSEREQAKALFKGKKGKQLEREIGVKSKMFATQTNGSSNAVARKHTAEEVAAIKAAIDKATTLQEIERLNQLLKQGHVPGKQIDLSTPATIEV